MGGGVYYNRDGQPRTLALHWNGSVWQEVETHPFSDCYEWRYLTGVSANRTNAHDVWVSKSDVWAVGYDGRSNSPDKYVVQVEHWDGTSWSVVSSNDSGTENLFKGVYGFANGAVTVGEYFTTPQNELTLGTVVSCATGAK